MKVVSTPSALEPARRAVAIGSFDGVHRGHLAVVDAVRATGLEATVVTFDPHPRIALGNKVDVLTTLERRLELLEEADVEAVVVASFTPELQQLTPEEFAEHFLRATGVEVVVAGEDFRFGVRRSGDLTLLERLGYEVVVVPELPGVSSTAIRAALGDGDVVSAAAMLGRPFELDGLVVAGDQRGGTLGFPTANLRLEPDLACPRYGIYAGFGLGHRAAISIGTNPHYGGTERRIEPYLLDFDGDLYGKRLVVELWERLRDEAIFENEEALIAQIARDVEATKAARRPVPDLRGQA
jgi:riboflavin kinase / FMN adenylyltransferase